MKKSIYKLAFVVAFGLAPTMAHATFNDCRKAGGSWFGCFYEAAMNDQIAAPQGDRNCTLAKKKCARIQVKKSFDRNKNACRKVPVKDQVRCLSRGMPTVKRHVSKKQRVNKSAFKKMQIKSN